MTAVISRQCTEQIVAMNHHTSQVKSILKKGKSLRRIKGIKKRIGKAKRAKGRTLVSDPVIAEPVHSCPSEETTKPSRKKSSPKAKPAAKPEATKRAKSAPKPKGKAKAKASASKRKAAEMESSAGSTKGRGRGRGGKGKGGGKGRSGPVAAIAEPAAAFAEEGSSDHQPDQSKVTPLTKYLKQFGKMPYEATGLELHKRKWNKNLRINIYWTRTAVGVKLRKAGPSEKLSELVYFPKASCPTATMATHIQLAIWVVSS